MSDDAYARKLASQEKDRQDMIRNLEEQARQARDAAQRQRLLQEAERQRQMSENLKKR